MEAFAERTYLTDFAHSHLYQIFKNNHRHLALGNVEGYVTVFFATIKNEKNLSNVSMTF